MRTALLKANYRLDADGHPELAERGAAVAQRLGVTVPVTLYQATAGFGLNAMLCHLPGEAHIVFTGPILAMLKFGEVSNDGVKVTVRYGRIGTQGQTQTKTFGTVERAGREVEKLTAEKLRKGYRDS